MQAAALDDASADARCLSPARYQQVLRPDASAGAGQSSTSAPARSLALLGENGAGKSTLSSIIAGSVQPEAGRHHDLARRGPMHPPRRARRLGAGIGLIHQEIRLLPHLSIAENIFVGRLPMRHGRVDRAYIEAQRAAPTEAPGAQRAGVAQGRRPARGGPAIGRNRQGADPERAAC